MTERYKKIPTKKVKVSSIIRQMSQKDFIYFPAQQWLQNTLTCCQLTLITVSTLALCLPLDQWFWNLHFTNNNIIAKCIVLSNIISVVSDNILRICIQEPSWHLKDV